MENKCLDFSKLTKFQTANGVAVLLWKCWCRKTFMPNPYLSSGYYSSSWFIWCVFVFQVKSGNDSSLKNLVELLLCRSASKEIHLYLRNASFWIPSRWRIYLSSRVNKKIFFKKSLRIVLYSSQSERTPRVMHLTLVAIRISVCIVKNTDLCKTGHTVEPDCLPCVWYNQFVKVIKRYLCKSINNKHETQESQLICLWRNRDLNAHHISPKLSHRSTVERCNLFSLWHFRKHHSLLSSLEYFAGVEATRCENVSETQLKQKPWVVLRCYNT